MTSLLQLACLLVDAQALKPLSFFVTDGVVDPPRMDLPNVFYLLCLGQLKPHVLQLRLCLVCAGDAALALRLLIDLLPRSPFDPLWTLRFFVSFVTFLLHRIQFSYHLAKHA